MRDSTGVYTYKYDALNRTRSAFNAFGKAITYAYDVLGQRRYMSDPDGGRWSTFVCWAVHDRLEAIGAWTAFVAGAT